jgi:hypothetical protein
MAQIDLTPKQIEELKNHYILELEKLQQRSAEIVGLLSKLVHGPIAPLPGIKDGLTQLGDKKEEITKHRGRPASLPNLSDFIIQLLQEKNKSLTSEQIIKGYQKQYKIDLSSSPALMSSLNQVLFRLRAKRNLITSSRRKGKRGNVYSLVIQADTHVAKTKQKKEEKAETAESQLPADIKHNWPQFIVDTLNQAKRVLSLRDFINHAMVQFSIPLQDKKSIYGKISPVLTHMMKAKEKLRSYNKEGSSRRFYALNEWFTDKNELTTIYKLR